jgi:hypothetical protein
MLINFHNRSMYVMLMENLFKYHVIVLIRKAAGCNGPSLELNIGLQIFLIEAVGAYTIRSLIDYNKCSVLYKC